MRKWDSDLKTAKRLEAKAALGVADPRAALSADQNVVDTGDEEDFDDAEVDDAGDSAIASSIQEAGIGDEGVLLALTGSLAFLGSATSGESAVQPDEPRDRKSPPTCARSFIG